MDNLQEILAAHGLWLETDEAHGMRANLPGANLSWANLSRANLRRANLSRADLSGTDLSGADLRRANLRRANLSRADLSGTDLSGANLSGTYLSGANLSGAAGYLCLGWDRRGYHFRAVKWADGWQVTAGCRNFTVPEAVEHWTKANNQDALARLSILAADAGSNGWEPPSC